MKTPPVLKFSCACLSALFLIVGCKPDAPEKRVQIGAILPLTGDAAQYGKALQLGADLAVEEINKNGGVDSRRLMLIYEDSKGEPTIAVSAVNKLISADRVKVIIGDMFSAPTLAIAPIAQRNDVVLVSPTASAQAVPRVGENIFSIYPSDAYDGQFLAETTRKAWPGLTRVALVYSQAEAMITAKEAFKTTGTENGLQLVSEQGIPPGTKDLSSAVTNVQGANPQIVFIAAYLPETAIFLRQAAQQGLKANFVGISTCYDPKLFELAGSAANGFTFSAPVFDVRAISPQVASFVTAYKNRFGKNPDIWAAYGYDVVQIVARALRASRGSTEAMRQAIASTSDYQGATGTTTIGPDRGVTKELRLLRADYSSNTFIPVNLSNSR